MFIYYICQCRDCMWRMAPTLAAALRLPIDRLHQIKIITNTELARHWLQFFVPFLYVSVISDYALPFSMVKRQESSYEASLYCVSFLHGLMNASFTRKPPQIPQYHLPVLLDKNTSAHIYHVINVNDDDNFVNPNTILEHTNKIVLIKRESRDIMNFNYVSYTI